jgi:putative ABC transport system permease protein
VAATLSRQRRTLARALVLTALTGSFAASTAVFNATYRQQAEADARLTNGGDVTVTEAPGITPPADTAARLKALPGVRTAEPIQHRFAYVGTDLQDLYGVRPDTIVGATSLQDGYFQGGTARQLMNRLRSTDDGVLVSAETVKDFQLLPGDQLSLRLQDAKTKQLVPVRFHYLGIAKKFPTAPRDSFLVANAGYVARATGNATTEVFVLDTKGTPPTAVARAASSVVGTSATVTDITTRRKIVGSSLTAVDLAGLTRVELGFALALAAAATGLVLALGLAERRRTFAIVGALGARRRQLAAFVWAEAATTAVGGLLAGALAGWALSEMLVKVLTGVFDPPPTHLAVPWGYLGTVVGTAAAAITVAALLAARGARRPAIRTLRDL